MVLATENGPLTVIYMPGTEVTDHEVLAFDGMEAMLVSLERGSAVIRVVSCRTKNVQVGVGL